MAGRKVATFADRLQELLDESAQSAATIASNFGIAKQTLSSWSTGARSPKRHTVAALADYFDVDVAWLSGYDVRKKRELGKKDLPPNIIPMPKMKKVPILGEIACGEPMYAVEQYEEYAEVDEDINCDFALIAHGDSMTDAGIENGYVVFVRHQNTVDDGEIAAVILDDEATLKRVRRIPGNMTMLEACNPKYEPIFIGGPDETRVVRILGRAVAFQGYL